MNYAPEAVVQFNRDNPAQGCLLDYFDITTEPGHTGVNRRDNGGYFNCVATMEANR